MRETWFWRLIHNLKVSFKTAPYTKGFQHPSLLTDHFRKHNRDFGYANETEYLLFADRFCGGKMDKNTIYCIRKRDGARVVYNRVTNELGIVGTDGIIKTYFKPKAGERYFRKDCVK